VVSPHSVRGGTASQISTLNTQHSKHPVVSQSGEAQCSALPGIVMSCAAVSYSPSSCCSSPTRSEIIMTSLSSSFKNEPERQSSAVIIREESNEVYFIDHISELPDEEIDSVWWGPHEYDEIKAAYRKTLLLMESGEPLEPEEEHSSRGLEFKTQFGALARRTNKNKASNAVMDEQDRQWQEGSADYHDEEISRIYLKHSKKCAAAAAARGLDDQREAFEVFDVVPPPPPASPRPRFRRDL
jgi:hypothetical protein